MSKRFRWIPFGFWVLIGTLAAPVTTSGQASVQKTTDTFPFGGEAYYECVGLVTFSGVYRQTESTRIDSAGGAHYFLHYTLTQLRASDVNGNEWSGVHVGQVSFNPNICASPGDCGSAPFETTWVDTLLFAGHGSAPNLTLRTRLRAVLNANGEETVFFEVTDTTCRN